MWSLIARLPLYRAFRRWGFPRLLPANVAVNLLYACNSRCLTCNVYDRHVKMLTPDELDRVFRSLGRAPVWVTLTGGEPFLRKDIPEIAAALYRRCRPAVVAIPTNGTFPDRVVDDMTAIATAAPRTRWVLNLSLDEIGERHDAIRRTPRNWELAMETYRGLRALRIPNLTVGLHVCISRFNAERFPEIHRALAALEPDSLIAEMAEARGELLNASADIAPSTAAYTRAIDELTVDLRRRRARGIPRILRALRLEYYALTTEFLRRQEQIVPCMAGWMSAHIGADGEVWTCSTRAEPLGNLRETGYDFRAVWFSARARALRDSIRRRECACPMASAAYTSLLADWASLARLAREYVGIGARAA